MKNLIESHFPHYMILKASAGSGKTTALTQRYVYFLLSDKMPHSGLKNILAITFSNNACHEMKIRIIGWLKDLYFKKNETTQIFSELLSIPEDELSQLAQKALEDILNNYHDFQVKTIDGFMTSIFKASALDFGYNPDFEILMNNESLMIYAYDLFLKDLGDSSYNSYLFKEIIEKIEKNKESFLWDPTEEIFRKIKELYSIGSNTNKEFLSFNESSLEVVENFIANLMEEIKQKTLGSGLERNLNNKIFDRFDIIVQSRKFKEILDRGIDCLPVKQPANKNLFKKYEEIHSLWENFKETIKEYATFYCMAYYLPYLKVLKEFTEKLNEIKRRECKIFIEDINKSLLDYLNESIVPDIYFRLGEKIYHFLIDEFQDTSPLQWINLKPLIENSLSEIGSLFVVGDTKQAIYSFRGADYRIMRELEMENTFPSAKKTVAELNKNFRSTGGILKFVEKVFKDTLTKNSEYRVSATLTGLDCCQQTVEQKFEQQGYVEIIGFYSEDENIKLYLSETIDDFLKRGYLLKDIGILAFKNTQVVNISSWLNELKIPFISYSSLDVRKRKVTAEILSLLKFLDSPVDDFSFSVFILGDIYNRLLEREKIKLTSQEFLIKNRGNSPLYKFYQKEFPLLWDNYFKNIFKLAGYLPVYDLVNIALTNFKVFETMPEEEATFLKILELVRFFESRGLSSIKDLIEFFSSPDDDEIWDITIGADIDAIQIMTVHKAKGLEFPVVILFLEDYRERADEFILHDIEEKLCVMKINEDIAKKNEYLKEIKDKERISKIADSLNTIYVAFTRAEKELYILFKIKKEGFPFDILSEFIDKNFGEKTYKDFTAVTEKKTMKVEHYLVSSEFSVSVEKVQLKEKQRGDFIHKVLSLIDFWDEETENKIEFYVERLNKELKKNFSFPEIKYTILKMFNNPQMKELFIKKSKRKVFNEFEISDSQGLIHRVDRVILDKEEATVVEYKTGQPSEKDFTQLELYLKLISEIYKDHKVFGCLYYFDLDKVIWR